MNQESILAYLPPSEGRTNYRLQCSLSLEEAAALEKYLIDPNLPFAGNMSTLMRMFVRYGLMTLHIEREEQPDSFLQSIRPILGSELLRWSAAACDSFALACTDHVGIATESGDPSMAVDVVDQVTGVLEEVQHASSKAMLKRALIKRGFMGAVTKLRQALLDEGFDVYWIDSTVAEHFG